MQDKLVDYADSQSSSDQDCETGTTSKGNLASSSGSNLKPDFIAMGFSPTLVEKVIKENGEDNVDLLLETLFANSALQKTSSESSDSLDAMFDHCKNGISSPEFASDNLEIEEIDVPTAVNDDKRSSLLLMNFSAEEVDFAIERLGESTPINELVDFIVAAQIAESCGKDTNDPTHCKDGEDEEISTESLFGTMDKTLRLLEMGFSEHEISSAIEKFGSEVPIWELADSIFANQIADNSAEKDKDPSTLHSMYCSESENDSRSLGIETEEHNKRLSSETPIGETDPSSSNAVPCVKDMDFEKIMKAKKPKLEYIDESTVFFGPPRPEVRIAEPKVTRCNMALPHRELHQLKEEPLDRLEIPHRPKPNPCRSINQMVAKPPYFFYGNVVDVSHDTWTKISQFLYAVEPEFVNTQFFSALSRKEGYIHNLPTDNRSHIFPRPSMTIEDAIPHTKKWWPSWDTRKQLSCISSETVGTSQLCERLGKILIKSQGMLSVEQQRDILHQCKALNLVWVGKYELKPIEPTEVECILGYPLYHTQVAECDLVERLQSLKHCFQTDTLGYHLSVLKQIFPDGLTMLSLYSGIGGAEVALQRLGVHLKGVVSVEVSATNRKILKKWWHNTGQTGELVQIEDIHRLTSNILENLINKFGGFDFVICQNPCTYISRSSKVAAGGDNPAGLDFPLFYEFVRVLQRNVGDATVEMKMKMFQSASAIALL